MPLHIALVHFPTIDKTGRAVCTSVTNLDLHDLSRAATTYGVEGTWIIHPYEPQRRFLDRVLRHWRDGWGSVYNPTRRESLERTVQVATLEDAVEQITTHEGRPPVVIGTSARPTPNAIGYAALRERMERNPGEPILLVFGTGWGLHPDILLEFDNMLTPIHGPTDWNHLSVRAAVAIILDRLRGR
jgi:hypothetical protein